MRRLLAIGLLLIALAACGEAEPAAEASDTTEGGVKQYSAHPGTVIEAGKSYSAVVKTNLGDMTFDLLADESPLAVNSFVFLAREGYFDGVIFHRIIPGFMGQSGDPTGTGGGGPGYKYEIETPGRPYIRGLAGNGERGTRHQRVAVLHRVRQPDGPGALSPDYSLFGQISDGEPALKALESVPVTAKPSGERSQPLEEVRISTIEIIER